VSVATVPDRERWLGVEMRHLIALCAIVREGSVGGAADSLGYVQSAISRQLATLERAVGARLVERSRGSASVAATPAGRLLLDHASLILERLQVAHAELAAVAVDRPAALRVGAIQSVAASLLPRVLARCPSVDISPTETLSDPSLFELVRRGELDLAFCQLPLLDGPFENAELLDDPFMLLVSTRSRWVDHDAPDPPALHEIGRLPLIGFHRSRAQDMVVAALRGHGVEPRFAHRCTRNAIVQALVGADLGVAILPRLSVDLRHPGTIAMELPEPPPRTIALIWHRERPPVGPGDAFVNAARAMCAR
jgi:DNA-binding transcriptional LysR family regulator